MTKHAGPYIMIPPVLSAEVQTTMDVMIARNTARRAASLLGFVPSRQAQLASVAATLSELVLKTGTTHLLNFTGVRDGEKTGVQLSIEMPWLTGVAVGNVMTALRSKLGDLIDEILIEGQTSPTIITVMWRAEDEAAHVQQPTQS